MPDRNFVIVGAGLAGAKAAGELRSQGFDENIVLIGSEVQVPYERPPLSKAYLRGEAARKSTFVHQPAFYADNGIDLRLSTSVVGIDPNARQVMLEGGETIAFDRLLLATGARSRRIGIPGADLQGVHYLRTIADSDALRSRFEEGGRLAIVGGGWIGAEVAASARQMGLEVTMLVRGNLPLERVVGPEVASAYASLHRRHGVEIVSHADVSAFEGSGSVEAVRLASGEAIDCATVLVAIGAQANVDLAGWAGIPIDGGVVVNEYLESSASGVFAAGDVANAWHPLYRSYLRLEHWDNAVQQGIAAASNMLGRKDPYDAIPYFYSDQYDTGLEYHGHAARWDSVVIRGDLEDSYIAFWLREGRIAAAMNVNVWDQSDALKALVRSSASVPEAELADPGVALAGLVRPLVEQGV